MAETKKEGKSKQLDFYIEGDDELRKLIFREPSLSQQAVFELFSNLDEVHYMFFLFYASIPSTNGLWDLFLTHLAAVASGTSKNRNYCEDYYLLNEVKGQSHCGVIKDKYLSLTGAAHAIWWELADPKYDEVPDARAIWLALLETGPSRQVWEWWFEARCRELQNLWDEYGRGEMSVARQVEMEAVFEAWMEKNLGLLKPRTHWYAMMRMMLDTFHKATAIKHRIARPYHRLAYTVAKSVAARNQPHQFFDTFDIACGGLMRAISKYAPSLSMSFSNFAKEEIRYEIYYQLGNYNLINLPNEMWQLHRKFELYKQDFIMRTQKYPSIRDLALAYNLDYATVYEVYFQVGLQNPFSLDTKVYPEDDSARPITLKEKIEDHEEKEAQKVSENSELILLSLMRMPLQNRKIFGLIYNLCDLLQEIEPDQTEIQDFFFTKHLRVVE
jgi:DNA-directed RNA polymerase specialized sigma subunit